MTPAATSAATEKRALGADQTLVDLVQFPAFPAVYADQLFTVPDGDATTLDTLIELSGQTVRLTVPLERLVFAEE